jgi:hypothetical protein
MAGVRYREMRRPRVCALSSKASGCWSTTTPHLDRLNASYPPGSESVLLRMDPKTHPMELLVGFPAGHLIAPHTHESNERIMVLEGQLTLRPAGAAALNVGGYAYLPAGGPILGIRDGKALAVRF